MGTLRPYLADGQQAEKQLSGLKRLLESKDVLSEAGDVLPFFKDNPHCAALLGTYHPDLIEVDTIATEYPVFGSFRADLVVADAKSSSYCFVEFEDASEDSIFKEGARETTFWSRRFLGGYSQLVDWFARLDDESSTGKFDAIFGGRQPRFVAMLVIGRDRHLRDEDKLRLEWWRQNVSIEKRRVYVRTFDELYADLSRRMVAAKALAATFIKPAV